MRTLYQTAHPFSPPPVCHLLLPLYQTVCPLFRPLLHQMTHPLSPPLPHQTAHPLSPLFHEVKNQSMWSPLLTHSLFCPSSKVCGDTQVVVMALCTTGTPDLELSLYIMVVMALCTTGTPDLELSLYIMVVMALCTTGTPHLELSLYIMQTVVHQQLEWDSNKHAGGDKKHYEVAALHVYCGCLLLSTVR